MIETIYTVSVAVCKIVQEVKKAHGLGSVRLGIR